MTYMPKVNFNSSSATYISKSAYATGKKYFEDMYKNGILPDCSRGFIKGSCNCETYAKNILCGKEYCADCGREGSPQHQKRFNRWLPKARALNKFGVLVVTIPEQLRHKYQSRQKLSELRSGIKNKLKKLGYNRGLMRWHLFGDCAYCQGKQCYKCNFTGAGDIYKPHLNIVIETGYIKDIDNSNLIVELKKYIKAYWKKTFNQLHDNVINYHYAKRMTDRVHQIKYITRSTFRIYNQEIEEDLYKYRLTTVWGTWQDAKIEKEEAIDNNCCLDCNSKIRWIGFNNLTQYQQIKHLEHGKFKIIATNSESQTFKKSTRLRIKTTLRAAS